jgi:predicted transcriptional regulator
VGEIAARLGISDGAVKRYLSDASKRLATELKVEADWRTAPEFATVVSPPDPHVARSDKETL